MPTSGVDSFELKGRVKTLQGMVNEQEIGEMLVWLKKNVVATEPLLRETKAGLAVGKLRTHSNKTVSDLAKELVKKWKGEVDSAKSKTSSSAASTRTSEAGTPQPRPTVDTAARGPSSVQSPSAASPITPSANGTGVARSAKIDGIKGVHGDTVRDKCIEMFYDALCIDSSAPPTHIHNLSIQIEKELFAQHDFQTTANYRTKFRSLYLNLKDKSNPRLRQDVVSSVITPEKLTKMSTKEMASDQRKQEDKKLSEANFHQALGSEELAAETDAFQCSRCKQRKTRYYQQQTRSADEPMTTFVTCTNCGHKWKFS